jgi:hypothetical protein
VVVKQAGEGARGVCAYVLYVCIEVIQMRFAIHCHMGKRVALQTQQLLPIRLHGVSIYI